MGHKIDFFKDEIRNGFYIPTAIKQAWASILDVLDRIDEVCRRHNISYFADWGTLLGAVRHGGFIPWDDDLDICMLREDYIRFREVAGTELPSNYVIHDFESRDDHWLFLSRVVNNDRICFEEDYLDEHYNFPYLACVDIFVLDYLYPDDEIEKLRDSDIMRLVSLAYGLNSGRFTVESIAQELDWAKERFGVSFSGTNEGHIVEREIYRLAQELMAFVNPDEAYEVGHIFPWILKGKKGWPKEYFEKTVRVPFEDTTIPVPLCYNNVLNLKYRKYCEVRKVWVGHDYPFFEGQKRDLEIVNGEPLPEYQFEPGMLDRYVICRGEDEGVRYEDLTNEDRENLFSDEVLFLPTGPERWECFEGIYEHYKKSGTRICVVPLPVMRKNVLGEVISTDSEIVELTAANGYPEGVEIEDWLLYDIREHRPREIYIQDPYDDKNPYLTIPPAYYASLIRLYTERLIFVPFKKTGEFGSGDTVDQYNLKHYLIAPGIIYADEVFAYSENLRQQYINALISFSGDKYSGVWEKRIVVREYAKNGSRIKPCDRRLLCCIGLNEITEHGEEIIKAVSDRLRILAEEKKWSRVSVAFYPPDFDQWHEALDDQKRDLAERLWNMVRDMANLNDFEDLKIDFSRTDETADSFDAYYGSPTPMIPSFMMQNKPVVMASDSYGLQENSVYFNERCIV